MMHSLDQVVPISLQRPGERQAVCLGTDMRADSHRFENRVQVQCHPRAIGADTMPSILFRCWQRNGFVNLPLPLLLSNARATDGPFPAARLSNWSCLFGNETVKTYVWGLCTARTEYSIATHGAEINTYRCRAFKTVIGY